MVHAIIKLADLPIDVTVCHRQTAEKYREFLTKDFPIFSVFVTPAEIASEHQMMLQLMAQGLQIDASSLTDAALEDSSVYHQVAERLPQFDAMLFHGSAVSLDGQAYLFLAPSGTGKSTHTRLWREYFGSRAVMVNDDKPMLRFREDSVWICGTPWQGKHNLGSNITVPLRAAVILTRDEHNHIEPVAAPDAFPALLQQCYIFDSTVHAQKMLHMVERLAASIPIYRLGCNMEPDAARVAYEGMQR